MESLREEIEHIVHRALEEDIGKGDAITLSLVSPDAAVVGRSNEIKGQAIASFVTLEGGRMPSEELKKELCEHVVKEIGALARPDDIRFAEALPKTRSGKIMLWLLREIATNGKVTGDVTTLEDFSVLERLREEEE